MESRQTFFICTGLLALALLFCGTEASLVCKKQTLSSHDYRYVRQRISGAVHVQSMYVVKQRSKSPCIPNVTFGSIEPDVFVDNGCRADFNICYEPGQTKEIRCESQHFKEQRCHAGGYIRYLTVQRSRSNSPCLEGFSYHRQGQYIVVNKGCRATFLVGL